MLNFPRVGSKFIHQVLHQINFFNPNSESCVNTIGVDDNTWWNTWHIWWYTWWYTWWTPWYIWWYTLREWFL